MKKKVIKAQVQPVIMPCFSYDKDADVMYISFGNPLPCITNEMGNGLFHRYTSGKKLNGITIINYSTKVV